VGHYLILINKEVKVSFRELIKKVQAYSGLSWKALKKAISEGQINHVRAQ
jgi:DNA-directed RNA polymerase delta subunit